MDDVDMIVWAATLLLVAMGVIFVLLVREGVKAFRRHQNFMRAQERLDRMRRHA